MQVSKAKHKVTEPAAPAAPTVKSDPAFQLLCENCGYILDGTPTNSNCAECGTPVAESLPSIRIGSPFQRQPGLKSLIKTVKATLTQPRAMFRNCRISYTEGRRLEQVYIFIAAAAFAFSFPVAGLVRYLLHGSSSVEYLVSAVPFAIGGWALLTLLTWIERRGIRLWGRVHRRRITPAVAATICGHASVGWTLAGLIVGCGFVLMLANLGYRGQDASLVIGAFLYMLGVLAGLLIFEILTYIGLKICKFANHPNPTHTTSDRPAKPIPEPQIPPP